MPKRKGEDGVDIESNVAEKKKNSLDSDEEDDNPEKYDVWEEDDIDGQEDPTLEFDGDIKITPFNLKEECEEGNFDKDGNYHFKKNEEQIRDAWLDNIDWVKVKYQEKSGPSVDDNDDDSNDLSSFNKFDVYRQMLDLMKPKETVTRALKRLGGNGGSRSASKKWLRKTEKDEEKVASQEEDREKFFRLTELADSLVSHGDVEIYGDTFEKLEFKLNKKTDAAAVVDMFSDDFDNDMQQRIDKKTMDDATRKDSEGASDIDSISWEFKWTDEESAEIHGPHSSAEMQQWVTEGYFDNGVWVRKCKSEDAKFYNSKRIDFDLYI